MHSKLITACTALVALASIALPASAAAANDPQLTSAGGTVAAGTKVEFTSVGDVVMWNTATTLVLAVYSRVTVTGEMTENGGGSVRGKLTTAAFSGTGPVSADNGLKEGTGEIGNSYATIKNLPLELSSTPTMNNDEFQVTGSAGANVKFLLGSTVGGECEYQTASSIKGDYTTGNSAATDAKLTTRDTAAGSGAKLIRGGFLCPTSFVLAGTFTMEKDNIEEAIWIS